MPWIMKDGERQFVWSRPSPGITLPDPKAPWPDLEGAARLSRERAAVMLWWKREIAEYCELHRFCPRVACRRSAACRGLKADCHDENFDALKQYLYPDIMKALRARTNVDAN